MQVNWGPVALFTAEERQGSFPACPIFTNTLFR